MCQEEEEARRVRRAQRAYGGIVVVPFDLGSGSWSYNKFGDERPKTIGFDWYGHELSKRIKNILLYKG